MNVEATQTIPVPDEMEVRAALIARCRLPPSSLDQIDDMMRNSGLGFAESALQLGFVSQGDMDATMAWLRQSNSSERVGLVEGAIRKLSTQQQVVVRPRESVKPSPQLLLARDSYDPRSEVIRTLRTELLLRNESGRANVVCLVSPSGGEGRSQLAAELAMAFAMLGRRTILVDADLRRPSQHILFQARNERGLGDALMRADKPVQYSVDGLAEMSLLTAGMIPTNPLELMSSGRFERLLADWRNSNEFVVIDTPPIMQYADALAVATLTGRVLVVSRAEHTSYKDVKEMMRRLSTTRAQILGAAINYF